jgi:murein DD-endopeptidase MepM/ murein hydrolase activator NlpD
MLNYPRLRLALVLAVLAGLAAGCAVPRWPVAGVVTSPFGLRLRGWLPDLHEGVDVAAAEGTPVRALMGGTVSFAGTMSGYGNVVYVQHGSGTTSIYAHLSSVAVSRGARVDHGTVIGAVGRTGSATGPHLHLEVWQSNRPVDPVPLLGGFPPAR